MKIKTNQLTFTRFIAAYLIVIFHFGLNVFPFFRDEIHFIFRNGAIGVSYFFILSGFVMVIAYGNKEKISARNYFVNRIARIAPVYYLSMLMYVLIVIFNFQEPIPLKIVLQFLMIQSWFPGYVIGDNVPTWSIAVELFFYVLFPFLMNKIYKRNFKFLVFGILIFWLLSQIFHHYLVYHYGKDSIIRELVYYFPLFHLNQFLVGNLIGFIFLKYAQKLQRNYDFMILLLIILIVLSFKFSFNLDFHNGLLAVLFAPFILFLACNNGVFTKVLSNKFLVFLGDISYGLYILQLPVFLLARKLPIDNPTILFFVYSLILILLSIFSYLYIEKPLRRIIKNKFSDKNA